MPLSNLLQPQRRTTAKDTMAEPSAARAVGGSRDYAAERAALLEQAAAARAEADAIDLSAEAHRSRERTATFEADANARAESSADAARSKIALQQDRFKAGCLAEGLDLDGEMVEVGNRPGADDNKYDKLMSRRKQLQEDQKQG